MRGWLWYMFQRKVLGRSDVYGADEFLYMRRWKLGRLRVHHIVRSDADKELHDHPFDFTSFIVKGGYWEHVPCWGEHPRSHGVCDWGCKGTRIWRAPFTLVRRKAEDLHRIELARPCVHGEAWTIVWRGAYRREWGFMTKEGWLNWQAFTALKNGRGEAAGKYAAPSSI